MNSTYMLSFWEKDAMMDYDFSIVGGGILGLFTAIELCKKNPLARISIFEKGITPLGATTRNAGFACFGSMTEIFKNFDELGIDNALEIIERRFRGIEKLKTSFDHKKIDYFTLGGHELIFEEDGVLDNLQFVNSKLQSIFKKDVFQLAKTKIAEFGFASTKVQQIIFNPYEGQLHSGKLMNELLKKCSSLGIKYYTGAEVTGFSDGNRVKYIVNDQVEFSTSKLIYTTNAFSPTPDSPIKPGRGQVLITLPIRDLKVKGTFHFDEGYYYFRNVADRILIGGGRNLDFIREETTEFYLNEIIQNDLIQKLTDIILPGTHFEIDMQWAGIMAFSQNHLPLIQNISQNVLYAMNCNGMGVSLSPITAEEIADKI